MVQGREGRGQDTGKTKAGEKGEEQKEAVGLKGGMVFSQ